MPEDAALNAVVDQAVRLAEKWVRQTRPNEDVTEWDLSKIDKVARDIVVLNSIDRKLLISKANDFTTEFTAPEIPHQDHSKEVVALGAMASSLLAALLQVALKAHEAGLAENANLRILRGTGEYDDLLKNIELEIQEANEKIDSLKEEIENNKAANITVSLGIISFDISFLQKILSQIINTIADNSIISVLYLKDLLLAARKNAELLLNHIKNIGNSFIRKASLIGYEIAISTTKAWKSGLVLVKRVAGSVPEIKEDVLDLEDAPVHITFHNDLEMTKVAEVLGREISVAIGKNYNPLLEMRVSYYPIEEKFRGDADIKLITKSLNSVRSAVINHKSIVVKLTNNQRHFLNSDEFWKCLADNIRKLMNIEHVLVYDGPKILRKSSAD